ncbi:hypothetical protein G6F35_017946 [Rhizopus arrhizus]|nr:hypothetical protein G6F35_017946 [Rhizopus arrhizus]
MSAPVIARGGANWLDNAPICSGTAEGASAGWPSAAGICRPGWLICIHICTPRARAVSAQAMKRSRWRSSSSTTPPGPVMARPSTITLPVMISPAPPSAQR